MYKNKLDALIEERAWAYFRALGQREEVAKDNVTILRMNVLLGYNSRAEILRLLKMAVA